MTRRFSPWQRNASAARACARASADHCGTREGGHLICVLPLLPVSPSLWLIIGDRFYCLSRGDIKPKNLINSLNSKLQYLILISVFIATNLNDSIFPSLPCENAGGGGLLHSTANSSMLVPYGLLQQATYRLSQSDLCFLKWAMFCSTAAAICVVCLRCFCLNLKKSYCSYLT